MSEDQAVLPFESDGRIIRRQWVDDRWYFSVIDVVAVLTDSRIPRNYWSDLKRRLADDEGFTELHAKIVQLKMRSMDGKKYATDATLLLLAGVHPKVVSEMLGHASIAITLDLYSHVLPDMQREATLAMERALNLGAG